MKIALRLAHFESAPVTNGRGRAADLAEPGQRAECAHLRVRVACRARRSRRSGSAPRRRRGPAGHAGPAAATQWLAKAIGRQRIAPASSEPNRSGRGSTRRGESTGQHRRDAGRSAPRVITSAGDRADPRGGRAECADVERQERPERAVDELDREHRHHQADEDRQVEVSRSAGRAVSVPPSVAGRRSHLALLLDRRCRRS